MKNVLLTLVFLGVLTTSHAQDLTGKYFFGGSLGFESTSGNSDVSGTNYNNPNGLGSYSFSPSFGYYIKKKLAIGLQLGYSSSNQNVITFNYSNNNYQSIPIKEINQVVSIAPLLRYTIPILETVGFNFNFTLPFNYTRSNDKASGAISSIFSGEIGVPNNYSTYSLGLNISPGFQWFINNKIALLGTFGALSYTHFKTNAIGNVFFESSTTYANDLKLSLTTGISLGINFYFGGKIYQITPYSK